MSVYAIERIKQIMDLRVNHAVQALVENTLAIEQVESWLEDDASWEAYRRELSFVVLRNLLKDDATTIQLTGGIGLAQWEVLLATAKEQLKKGTLPELDYPPSPEWLLPYLYASTFVLGQYQYGEAVRVQPGDVFLDCGGCGGETSIWAQRLGAGKVFCFEPNPEILPYLERNLSRHCPAGVVEIVSRAVGETPGVLPLAQGWENIGGSNLQASGAGTPVPVITLDGWCRERGIRPSFIKMDLEGFEVAALLGARQTITTYRPKLAISLYHRLSDMWVIPRMIKEFFPGYALYCRKNAPITEFVLYAVPA